MEDFGKYIRRTKDQFKGELVYPRLNNQFNIYAYYLSNQNKLNEGLSVLLDAVELFPGDANLFDSAGEYYLAEEDSSRAVEIYRKSLDVNPNLRSSIDYLIKHTRVKTRK